MKELLISALMLLGTSLACGQRLQTPTLSPITKITQQQKSIFDISRFNQRWV